MTIPVRTFLVRHGQVAANAELRFIGVRDDPLTAVGREQAEHISRCLAELPLAHILSSPLSRARATARRIAETTGLVLRSEPRLAEQSFGDWEGLTRQEILELSPGQRQKLEQWEADPASSPPGGESLVDVQSRALEVVRALQQQHAGEWVALVSHVGPIKALVCAALEAPLSLAQRFVLDPGTICVVDWGRRPLLRLLNAHGHMGWRHARWMQ